jgi:hypothetical protein
MQILKDGGQPNKYLHCMRAVNPEIKLKISIINCQKTVNLIKLSFVDISWTSAVPALGHCSTKKSPKIRSLKRISAFVSMQQTSSPTFEGFSTAPITHIHFVSSAQQVGNLQLFVGAKNGYKIEATCSKPQIPITVMNLIG